jgi:hypothetical protein
MATAERRTYPDDSRPMRLAAVSKRTVRPFGVNGALGATSKRLPIMIMDQQKSPKNLPEETLPHHNRSGPSLLG